MSYDILFVPRAPGQSWEAALDEAEGRDVLGETMRPERLAQWDRVVATLRQRLGELDVTVGDDTCEATHASGLQVSLYPDEASISFPYVDRADRRQFHDLVVDAVGTLERETGLHAWDAQTDAPFDGHVHDGPGLSATRRIGQQTSDVATTEAMAQRAADGALGPDTGPVDVREVPAVLADRDRTGQGPVAADVDLGRRRGLRYVVIGAVVVVAALLLRSRGEAPTLSGLLLAVGVADVVIGAFLYRSARARTHGPRTGTGGSGT